ncbi:hypothetical protein ACFYT4_08925 [Streptomyces sp. NPDC004609]|uniref:hypothetical protein n=1 Tax=Streptomyces sp. NPDC004609 TaxID=3364704 RepID=UPI003684D037
MKNELILIIGWVAAVQGGLGAAGQQFGDGPWGLLHKWWDIPTAGYAVILVVGLAIALTGEARKRGRS